MLYYLSLKKIDKVFFGYFLKYFIASITLFISIFFLFSFLQIINDKDIVKGLSPFMLTKAIIYLIPSVLSNSVIFASVFSAFFSIGEISLSGELIATRCCGYSYLQMISKIILSVIIFIPFLLYLNHSITPYYRLKSHNYIKAMTNKTTNIKIKNNSFENISSYTIIAQEANRSHLGMVNIIKDTTKMVADNKKANFIINIEAKNGIFNTVKEKGIILSLNEGKIYYLNKDNPEIFYIAQFNNYLNFIPFETNEKNYSLNYKFLTTKELKKLLNEKYDKKIISEILSRTTSVVAFFFITILSFILAFLFEKDSKYFSFIASIGIILIYYGIEILTEHIIVRKTNIVELKIITPIILTLTTFLTYFLTLRRK